MRTWRIFVGVLMTLVLATACATKVAEPWHKFAFDGWNDKWYPAHELLEYSYGDKYRMVRASVITPEHPINEGKSMLPPSTGVNGPMPLGNSYLSNGASSRQGRWSRTGWICASVCPRT